MIQHVVVGNLGALVGIPRTRTALPQWEILLARRPTARLCETRAR